MKFSPEYERDVITAMFRHPNIFSDYQEVIPPKTFSVPALRKFWHILQEFHREHKELPTATTLVELIDDKDQEGFFLSEDMEYLLGNIDPIMNGTPVNEQFVISRLLTWVKEKRLRSKVSEAVRKIESKEAGVDDVLRIIKEAEISSELQKTDEEEDFASGIMDHIIAKRLQPNFNIIPTNITTLDECIGGGPKRGYKVILMGNPGGGKTTTAVQICGAAVEQGLGAYYLFNDDTPVEMNDRFISHFSYIPTTDIADDMNEEEIKAVQDKLERCRGELGLRYIDQGTTPSQVRRMVERRIESGHPVDILVVDHIRNMSADTKSDSSWGDIGNIFCGLMSIAIEFDLILYVIMHTHRSAEGRSYINNSHIGLSYEPVKDANLIVGVWRSSEDMGEVPYVRMQITKHRGGPGLGTLMRFRADFETMRLYPIGDIVATGEDDEEGIYDPTK